MILTEIKPMLIYVKETFGSLFVGHFDTLDIFNSFFLIILAKFGHSL